MYWPEAGRLAQGHHRNSAADADYESERLKAAESDILSRPTPYRGLPVVFGRCGQLALMRACEWQRRRTRLAGLAGDPDHTSRAGFPFWAYNWITESDGLQNPIDWWIQHPVFAEFQSVVQSKQPAGSTTANDMQ
ncbi:MAG: hypothetical protein ACREK1_04535 [Longimicrobiales bacterium]